MLTESEYIIAWSIYICAAFGILAPVWRILGYVSVGLIRKVVVGVIFALLLTPWTVSDSVERFAPALFISVFDATLHKSSTAPESVYRAFFPLLLVLSVVLIAVCAAHILIGMVKKRSV